MTAHISSTRRRHDDGQLLRVHSQGRWGAPRDQRVRVPRRTIGGSCTSGVWRPSVLDDELGTAMAPCFVAMKDPQPPPKTHTRRAVYASNLNPIFYPDLNIFMFKLPAYLLGYAYASTTSRLARE